MGPGDVGGGWSAAGERSASDTLRDPGARERRGTPLRFTDLDVRTIGPGTAIAFGRYILCERDSVESTATGVCSLTLHRADEVWRIVHDHSSADDSV